MKLKTIKKLYTRYIDEYLAVKYAVLRTDERASVGTGEGDIVGNKQTWATALGANHAHVAKDPMTKWEFADKICGIDT